MSRPDWAGIGGATALLASLLVLPASLAGQSVEPSRDTVVLTLAEARQLALQQNPSLEAIRQESAIAQGQRRQAGLLSHNPELAMESPGSATRGNLGEYELSLTQEVEWAGQRGLRIDAAGLQVERTGFQIDDATLSILARVSFAYYAALAAARRLAIAREVFEVTERLLVATRAQLREGEISVLEANLAEIESGRAVARVLAMEREDRTSREALNRLMGAPAGMEIRLTDNLPPLPDPSTLVEERLAQLALARRPDLAADKTTIREFEALHRLAARTAIPNLRIGLRADRAGVGNATQLGMVIGVTLPLWNRNQGVVAERTARIDQARLRRRATELLIRSEVAASYRAYLAASEEAAVYESSVIATARGNRTLLETAYRAGKISLPTVLLLRNQLLDAELGYWDAWYARRSTLTALQTATATIADDTGLPTNDAGIQE